MRCSVQNFILGLNLISLKKLGKPRNTLVRAYGTNPGTRLPVMFGSKTDNNAVSEALL